MRHRFPDIADLVPHRHPMLLLDAVVDYAQSVIVCTARIDQGHPFLEGEVVDALVCVELVAQTVAAYAGYQDHLAGRAPSLGFLVSCREARFDVATLALGDALRVEARHTWGDDRLGSFAGRVLRKGEEVASIEVGVYRGPLDSVPRPPAIVGDTPKPPGVGR